MTAPAIKNAAIRLWTMLAAMTCLFALSTPAQAEVDVHFHSFNGSVLWGRYPHTFVVFEGALEDGSRIDENFGFSARSSVAAMTSNPAEHMILVEDARTIRRTNHHFSVRVSDEQYRVLRDEVTAWRDNPGKLYDLDENNCIHFVAKLAELVGLRADVPERFLRRPKAWLNYLTSLNPQLDAVPID